ncbi:MAG: acylglycerol lipase [Verrucomicrobiales bacterium]|jgi:acylglycerol lipase
MPDPSSQFAGASTAVEVTGRHGVAQYRRTWAAETPHANALILHGVAEHSGRYEHVGATLAKAGISALAYDSYGHGRSGGRRGHADSMDVLLDDVEDNLAELREDGLPVILLGHSLGGLWAFTYCVSGRPAPDVLLLSGPALGAEVPAWQRIAAPILGRVVPKFFVKTDFEGGLLSVDPDVGTAYIDDPLRVRGQTAGLGLAAFSAMKMSNERLETLSVPTMVFHGENDRIVPAHYTEPIGDLAIATRQVLPGLEHEVLNEASWEQTMLSFINFANETIGHTP